MSIIGPRASEWDAVNTFLSDEIDKMKVRPGITGLSQAYYRNSVSPRKKRLLDAWYAMMITDKDKLNSLNDQVTEWMGIKPNKASIWQMKCDKFLADMENIITKKYVM